MMKAQPSGIQHGFYARPSAHLPCLAALAGLGTILGSLGIVRFVQGGVVKTFRCTPYQVNVDRTSQRADLCDAADLRCPYRAQ